MGKRIDDATLLAYVKADIEAAELYFSDEVEQQCIKRLRRFLSDPTYYEELFPQLSKRSSLTMSDVADTVYWVMPSLMRVFFGSSDVITVTNKTAEDNAEPMHELCNWQIQRMNKGFIRFYKWFMDAMMLGHGVMKIRWERRTKMVTEDATMTPDEFAAFDPDAEGVKFLKAEETPEGMVRVKVRREAVVRDQPVLENVPVSEFGWLPDTGEVEGLQFCFHKRLMTRSEIESNVNAGVFSKVTDQEIAGARYNTDTENELRSYYTSQDEGYRDGAADLDKSRTQYWVYECFGKYDIDGDNISEDMIVTVIGDKIVRVEENELGRPHFAMLSPYPDQYQLTGKTIDDMIGELQDIKVAMYRQIVVNVANNNDRQAIVDEDAVNPDDLRENRRWIRASKLLNRPVSSVVQFMPEAPLSSAAFPLLQQLDSIKENRTGVTKYNQGGDSKDLNKTATGITAIMNAANQRIEMIARMFAETGIIDLFRLLVEMNSRYMDQEVVIRLTNGQPLQVRPDDLKGEYDLDIAAGVGTGQRQEAVQNMMLLLTQVYPAAANMGMPADPVRIAETVKVLLTQMGYKDSTKFFPTPEEVQQQQQQMMMQQQQMAQEQQMMQAQDQQQSAETLQNMAPEQIEALMQEATRGRR